MSSFELSIGQQFDVERMKRIIDQETDINNLRKLTKQLLEAWMSQKAACNWLISQQAGSNQVSNSSS